MSEHKFPYRWRIADGYPAKGIEHHGCKVFGTFICGGGSSMGYKLAGFDHIGGVELDQQVAETYKRNHHPKNLYVMDIREFNELQDLPAELYNLDMLDGSPPCSTFSTAGSREDAWGKEKQFREGQKKQRLDDLVFVYCDTIAKLKPKCYLLENVSGLVKGNGKAYCKKIVKHLDEIGYTAQVFLMNGASMGLPQRRERVFIIGHKKEIILPKLNLSFNEEPIPFGEFADYNGREIKSEIIRMLWEHRQRGDISQCQANKRVRGTDGNFGQSYVYPDKVAPTLTAKRDCLIHFEKPLYLSEQETLKVSSFPMDYDTGKESAHFYCGMSVPPVMMAQISYQIYKQWLSKIKK